MYCFSICHHKVFSELVRVIADCHPVRDISYLFLSLDDDISPDTTLCG